MIIIDGIVFSLQRHGGISVYFHELLSRLASEKIQTRVCLEGPTLQELPAHGTRDVLRPARVFERYRRCRTTGAGAQLFHSTYYRRYADKIVPTVVTVHDFIYERLNSGIRRWVHATQKYAAIRSADIVICISEQTRRDLDYYVGRQPGQEVRVIYNGVSDQFGRTGMSKLADRPYILFVGQRAGYKNFDVVAKAMQFLPDFDLRCVGGGPFSARELSEMASGVRSRVTHLGYVTDAALNDEYNGATALVYPSSFEGFGIPVLEAMRAGCPVISADCAAVREIGDPALTVLERLDPELLASHVLALHEGARREAVIDSGLLASRRFSWRETHTKTLAAYRELVPDLNTEGT